MSITARARSAKTTQPAPSRAIAAELVPLVAVAFLGFLAVGIPLSVLPVQVHDALGFGTITVGWVVGAQSIATVLTRQHAGAICDGRGPKVAVLIGLPLASLAGLSYLVSALLPLDPGGKLAVLLLGRLLLGMAESLFLTGTMIWGIARAGADHTGRVMAWQGVAIFAALGLGAPIGLYVLRAVGFAGVAALAVAVPLVGVVLAAVLPGADASGGRRIPFYRVLGLIWQPGLAMALGTVPFGCMAAFLPLDFAAHGWSGAGLAIAAFSSGFVLVRVLLGHLPDRMDGRSLATLSLLAEGSGQVLLWAASSLTVACLGSLLTGIGFSLVFPALGVLAMRRVPAQNRGVASGGYVAFLDLSLVVAGPLAGAIAGLAGIASVFLVGAVATAAAIPLAMAIGGRSRG